MGKIYVVGIGPGDEENMTVRARKVLAACDVIVGYKTYTDLIGSVFPDKRIVESSMRKETDRCRKCIELARAGNDVALICSGDAGIYGMASPMLEEGRAAGYYDIEIVPGVTAALSGGAVLGAPVGHDMCTISLSDLLTPWDLIEKRLRLAADADLCIVLYNPASHNRADHLKSACRILLEILPEDRCCGWVRNVGRSGSSSGICTLADLSELDADMFTTVFIGNSATIEDNGRMITPRGYTRQ